MGMGIFALLTVLTVSPAMALLLPDTLAGFKTSTAGSCAEGVTGAPRNLYDIIDGGAEIYLDRGFKQGRFKGYTGADGIMVCVEIYDQGVPDSARSLYKALAPDGAFQPFVAGADSLRMDVSSTVATTFEWIYESHVIRLSVMASSDKAKAAVPGLLTALKPLL